LDQASVRWKAQCLRILWVTAGVREEKLHVSVAEANRCASSGFHREFDRTSQGWVARSGVGGVRARAQPSVPAAVSSYLSASAD
jgi:hypothetical protein